MTIDRRDNARPVVPQSLEAVTARWMSEALSVWRPGVVVASVTVTRVIHGAATKAFLSVTYSDRGQHNDLPEHFVLKAGYEPHSMAKSPVDIHTTEVEFYRDFAGDCPIPTPKCFYADADETTQGVLLLEDLVASGVVFGYATRPLDRAGAAAFMDSLAKLHARWWESPKIHTLEQAMGIREPALVRWLGGVAFVREFLAKENRAAVAPPSIKNPGRIIASLEALERFAAQGPHCLLHGDTHLGNTYVGRDGVRGLYDWQMMRRGSWARDVSKGLILALEIEDRRKHEQDLISYYLQRLESYGGKAPSLESAMLDYRRWIAWSVFVTLVNREPDFQPEEVNVAHFSRAAAAADDLDTFGALGV